MKNLKQRTKEKLKLKKFLVKFFRPTKGKVILTIIFSTLGFLSVIGIPILSTIVSTGNAGIIKPRAILFQPLLTILNTLDINIKSDYLFILLVLLNYYLISCLIIFFYDKIRSYIVKQNAKDK